MSNNSFWAHILDILKAAAAVAVVQAIAAFASYLGAHIPDPTTLIASLGGGFAAIKIRLV